MYLTKKGWPPVGGHPLGLGEVRGVNLAPSFLVTNDCYVPQAALRARLAVLRPGLRACAVVRLAGAGFFSQ